MADDLDQADSLTTAERDAGIARARASLGRPGLVPFGRCYACDEDVPVPKIFCDAECAASHQKARKRR